MVFPCMRSVSAKSHQRDKVERLCRYIARPVVSTHRMELLADDRIRYELKTPYQNGTTHVVFEPLDFISRLASLVPKPRCHLTRFHGVFAPNSHHRRQITREAKRNKIQPTSEDVTETVESRRLKMNWAMRLKRVFNIDVTACGHCHGLVKIIACIEDKTVIKKILSHINQQQTSQTEVNTSTGIRAPPSSIPCQTVIHF